GAAAAARAAVDGVAKAITGAGAFEAAVATGAGLAVAMVFAGVEPLARLERNALILRTRSSTPNGLNITSSDRTSAARAWTVPLSIPEMSRTGVVLIDGCARTYSQI